MKTIFFSLKILLIYFIFVTAGFSTKSQNFEKGKVLFEKKNLKSQNFFLKKILFITQKTRIRIYF